MKEQVVRFETAVLAKVKSFSEGCEQVYNLHGKLWDAHYKTASNSSPDSGMKCTAPSQSILQKWLRDKEGIHIIILYTNEGNWFYQTVNVISDRDIPVIEGREKIENLPRYKNLQDGEFSTYEDALEHALYHSLLLL